MEVSAEAMRRKHNRVVSGEHVMPFSCACGPCFLFAEAAIENSMLKIKHTV
jgi:hypothetical protein